MSARTDRENFAPQLEAIEAAKGDLRDRLDDLADVVKDAQRAANTKAFNPDIDKIQAAWMAVERSRDNVDIAITDLAGAKGADL